MRNSVLETIMAGATMVALLVFVFGSAWCDRTGRIDILLVSVAMLGIVLICDKLRGKKRWKKRR